jgi:hypothetical protein
MVTSPNWLSRYRDGQESLVWHELRQLGRAVHEPQYANEAQLVCDEMAQRARQNIETIVERLTTAGYRFHINDDEQTPVTPFFPASERAAEHAEWLRERFADVPMTLLSWVRIVGDVWLVGTHPQWPESAAADPLVLQIEGLHYPDSPIRDYFASEHEAWEHAEPFVLPLSPDRLHKDNVSGGPPYGMILPDGCADGLFVGETTMPFVSYLDWVFRNGGFARPVSSMSQNRVKREVRKGLLPL